MRCKALISLMVVFVFLLPLHAYAWFGFGKHKAPSQNEKLITKTAELVADKNTHASPKKLPEDEEIQIVVPPEYAARNSQTNGHTDRCSYNRKTYAMGDIVKTADGWIRCMPTITFSLDAPRTPLSDHPAWVKVE